MKIPVIYVAIKQPKVKRFCHQYIKKTFSEDLTCDIIDFILNHSRLQNIKYSKTHNVNFT
jgi:hypothetical protein